jgi:hypothetical protein
MALSLNISILQLKLKKRFGEKNIKKIWDEELQNNFIIYFIIILLGLFVH